jgi:hypothetical protein
MWKPFEQALKSVSPVLSKKPRAQFVRVDDPNFGEIVAWLLARFPGIKHVSAKDGFVIVGQIFQGSISEGQVHGEARDVLSWPGVVSAEFDAGLKEAHVLRKLRYDELPAELWGPTVA